MATDLTFNSTKICDSTTSDSYFITNRSGLKSDDIIVAFHNAQGHEYRKFGEGQTEETAEIIEVGAGGGSPCIFYKTTAANLLTAIETLETYVKDKTVGTLVSYMGTETNMIMKEFTVTSQRAISGKGYACEFTAKFMKSY